MSDSELKLLRDAKNGNGDAINEIMSTYKSLVVSIARKYYLIGGDQEDLIQEGMIGLFRAITTFDSNKGTSFVSFASKLIGNSIIDAVKKANSHSQQFLSDSILIDNYDTLVASEMSPEGQFISDENTLELTAEINSKLSRLEKTVVEYFLKGYSYRDIASILGKSDKTIDNTLSRIKKKLKYLKERL